ncbi:hypothetical protein GCM10009104_33500 [Marinobacterium maritimum]|uniref:Uncharacterized protein n=1 Tax=Marinobacterium maritimum TaxID=500162 RepID=A0ABN1IA87_9GAMM
MRIFDAATISMALVILRVLLILAICVLISFPTAIVPPIKLDSVLDRPVLLAGHLL